MPKLRAVKSVLETASALALILVAVMFVWSQFRSPGSRAAVAPVEEVRDEKLAAASMTNVLGHARVALVEFGDFECQFCARYARTVWPRVKTELVEAGLVQFAFLHFPLERIHRRALKASEAVECAGRQGKYWEMHDRLFANSPVLEVEDLRTHAVELGLNQDRFSRCLEGEATEKVAADVAEGHRLGVGGTPAFFLGIVADDGSVRLMKRINGFVSFDTIRKEVDEIRQAQIRVPR